MTKTDRACVMDSYESQVVCGGVAWRDIVRVGREGQGPGEFRALTGVAVHGSEQVAVTDLGNRRLTLLTLDGRVGQTIGFDGAPWIIRDAVDSVLLVVESSPDQWMPSPSTERRRTRIARMRPGEDELEWETLVLPEEVSIGDSPLVGGAWSPRYGYVFLEYPYRMVRFSATGEFLGAHVPAHYEPQLPSDRDVEARIRDLTSLFGRPPDAESIRAWREHPKRGVVNAGQITFSEDGLLWVAATRDRTHWSYVDVYADGGQRYLAAFRVRGRLLAFDVRGGTLAALVEEQDQRGIPANSIDWYDIGPWVDSHAGSPQR